MLEACLPAACHFIAVFKDVAGRKAGMTQSIKVVEVFVSHMDAAHVFLAGAQVE